MSQPTLVRRVVVPAIALAVAVAAPSVVQAQATISIGSGGAMVINGSGASKSAAESEKASPVSADSLKTLRAFARDKQPVVVIDGMVSTVKAFLALSHEKIGSVKLQEGDAEVRHYGKQAEKGVLNVRTAKAPADKKDAAAQPQGGTIKMDGGSIQFKTQ